MRKSLIALLALLALCSSAMPQGGSVVGPMNQISCNKSAIANVASATTASVVAGVAGQTISICGWHVTSTQSTSNTFKFVSGTQGGPCTSPADLTANFSITSTAPSAQMNSYANLSAPQGAQVCVVTTGATVGTAVQLFYAQF